jgi:hypothetical protein
MKEWGRQQGKDSCILTENILEKFQQHHKVGLNVYHESHAG